MQKRREEAPQLQKRYDQKGRDDEEGPEQRLPDALAEERKPAQAHAALETAGERALLRRFGRGLFWSKYGSHHLHGLARERADDGNLGSEAGKSEAQGPLFQAQSQFGSRSLASISS